MHYTHLAKEERYYVFNALKSGKSMRQVAREINRHVSTVSREVLRNKGLRGYRYRQADKKNATRMPRRLGLLYFSGEAFLAQEGRFKALAFSVHGGGKAQMISLGPYPTVSLKEPKTKPMMCGRCWTKDLTLPKNGNKNHECPIFPCPITIGI